MYIDFKRKKNSDVYEVHKKTRRNTMGNTISLLPCFLLRLAYLATVVVKTNLFHKRRQYHTCARVRMGFRE